MEEKAGCLKEGRLKGLTLGSAKETTGGAEQRRRGERKLGVAAAPESGPRLERPPSTAHEWPRQVSEWRLRGATASSGAPAGRMQGKRTSEELVE